MSNKRGLTVAEKLLATLVGIMSLLMLAQVISRYVFGKPLSFTEEAARLVFVWVVLFGATEAFRRNENVSIDIILRVLPQCIKQIVKGIVFVVIAVMLVMLLISGIKVVRATSHTSLITLPLPTSSVYMAIPVACSIMLLHIVWTIVVWFKKRSRK